MCSKNFLIKCTRGGGASFGISINSCKSNTTYDFILFVPWSNLSRLQPSFRLTLNHWCNEGFNTLLPDIRFNSGLRLHIALVSLIYVGKLQCRSHAVVFSYQVYQSSGPLYRLRKRLGDLYPNCKVQRHLHFFFFLWNCLHNTLFCVDNFLIVYTLV